jgi:hypothetical protein
MAFGFRKKKEKPPEIGELPRGMSSEAATIDNVKAKMDLVLTQMDSLRTQYAVMNERVQSMEKMLKEILALAKS